MDYGHKQTEKELAALERKIAKIYSEASEELQKTIEEYFANFEKRDKHQLELLKAGEITEDQYKQWRLAQMGRGARFKALQQKVAERYTEANKVAVAYVNDATPGIYSLNRNYAAYEIERVGANVDFTLWDEQTVRRLIVEEPELMPYYPPKKAVNRGIDLAWGKRQISASVTSGILLGKSTGKIATDLQSRMENINRDSAIRTARTAMTGAQNAGRMDSYTAAEKMGIELEKEWLATLDGRTRHQHRILDGQHTATEKPFEVDGQKIMFPGDPTAAPWLVYNCRCTLIARVKGVDTSDAVRRARDPETGESVIVPDMTYQEWEKSKKSVEKVNSGGIIIEKQISGALNPESEEAETHAKKYYASVRRMKTDVDRISANTGYPKEKVRKIKEFVFLAEHELEPGKIERFAPSYEMAMSWQRLIDGKKIEKHDITLLEHEFMELSLMEKGFTQDQAHIQATARFNYAREAYEYYDSLKRNKAKSK